MGKKVRFDWIFKPNPIKEVICVSTMFDSMLVTLDTEESFEIHDSEMTVQVGDLVLTVNDQLVVLG